jgi:putative thioredoxin
MYMAYSPNVIDVNETTFEKDVIQKSHDKTVVVDFWAAWCGPCRMLGPILEKLAAEPDSNFTLAKVDVDANPGLAMRYGVHGIPAVKAFRDGKIAADFVGAQPEPTVRQFIRSVAPSKADNGRKEAERLIAERKWAKAVSTFNKLLVDDPGNPELKLGLSRALIANGSGCEARNLLQELLEIPETHASAERLLPTAGFVCDFSENGIDGVELTVVEAQYRRAANLLGSGSIAPAMDGLLDVLRYNKNYRDGSAKQVLLGIFELLGDGDPSTNAYRRELASILF